MIPPVTKRETNARAKRLAVENWTLPFQIVPSQLKVLIAEGTPMETVRIENTKAVYGFIPLINM